MEARTEVMRLSVMSRKMVVACSRASAAKVAKREWRWDTIYRQRKCDLLMT